MKLVNWAGTASSSPLRFAAPADEAELCALVAAATAAGETVRVGGALHSWSAAAMTDGVAVNLDRLDRLVHVGTDEVTVQAGIRLKHLVAALAERGLALPITGSILEQSVAGAVSTGTHGSSLVHGCFASLVRGVRLVLADGRTLQLGRDHPKLGAAACSLGALGVISEVTLAVVPLYALKETQRRYPFDEATERFLPLGRAHEYAKFWWLPPLSTASLYHYDKTTDAPNVSLRARWFDEAIVNRYLFRGLLGVGSRVPRIIRPANRLVGAVYFADKEQIGRYDHVLTTPMPCAHRESEWAIPVDAAPQALRAIRDHVEKHVLSIDFILEARLVKGDNTWMSPSSGYDVCAVGLYAAYGPHTERYFAEAGAILRDVGGRPHWGKEFACTPDDVRRWYPRAGEFAAYAAELDPKGTFRSAWLDSVLAR